MSNQFAAPAAPSAGIQWADYNGALLLLKVHGIETGIQTVHGISDAVRANVAVIDGPNAGEEHEEVLVFPKVLQSQLKSRIGQMVLGRLGQGQGKTGQSPPWLLTAPTPEDGQAANQWLAQRNGPVAPAAPAQEQATAAAGGGNVPF